MSISRNVATLGGLLALILTLFGCGGEATSRSTPISPPTSSQSNTPTPISSRTAITSYIQIENGDFQKGLDGWNVSFKALPIQVGAYPNFVYFPRIELEGTQLDNNVREQQGGDDAYWEKIHTGNTRIGEGYIFDRQEGDIEVVLNTPGPAGYPVRLQKRVYVPEGKEVKLVGYVRGSGITEESVIVSVYADSQFVGGFEGLRKYPSTRFSEEIKLVDLTKYSGREIDLSIIVFGSDTSSRSAKLTIDDIDFQIKD